MRWQDATAFGGYMYLHRSPCVRWHDATIYILNMSLVDMCKMAGYSNVNTLMAMRAMAGYSNTLMAMRGMAGYSSGDSCMCIGCFA